MGYFLDRVWGLLLSWEIPLSPTAFFRGSKLEVLRGTSCATKKHRKRWKSRAGPVNSLHLT